MYNVFQYYRKARSMALLRAYPNDFTEASFMVCMLTFTYTYSYDAVHTCTVQIILIAVMLKFCIEKNWTKQTWYARLLASSFSCMNFIGTVVDKKIFTDSLSRVMKNMQKTYFCNFGMGKKTWL